MANLRQSAVAALDKEWETAIEQITELERVFSRLSTSLVDCSKYGGSMEVDFSHTSKLGQEWWIVYQNSQGAMLRIPTHSDEAPIPPLPEYETQSLKVVE